VQLLLKKKSRCSPNFADLKDLNPKTAETRQAKVLKTMMFRPDLGMSGKDVDVRTGNRVHGLLLPTERILQNSEETAN
jgi:hypothetical protein